MVELHIVASCAHGSNRVLIFHVHACVLRSSSRPSDHLVFRYCNNGFSQGVTMQRGGWVFAALCAREATHTRILEYVGHDGVVLVVCMKACVVSAKASLYYAVCVC